MGPCIRPGWEVGRTEFGSVKGVTLSTPHQGSLLLRLWGGSPSWDTPLGRLVPDRFIASPAL